jgi:hypothetical protein
VSGGRALKPMFLWRVTCLPLRLTSMLAAAEVIDLTGPSSPPPYLPSGYRTPNMDRTTKQPKNSATDKDADFPLEDGEIAKPTNTNPRKKRKHKKSQHEPGTTNGENESGDKRRRRDDEQGDPPRVRSHSPPDRAARRRTLREKSPDSLFFVDDKPADIRDPYVSPGLAGPSRAQQNDGLVLPPHVKVAGESSEAQEPSLAVLSDAEECDEDFIDYLDTDGDRRVCISLAEPLPPCTLIHKMKDWNFSLFP